MKKNGFVSTALIYTFFILFLLLMIFLLNSYSSRRNQLESFKNQLKEDLNREISADINLYTLVKNGSNYELKRYVKLYEHKLDSGSYCEKMSDEECGTPTITMDGDRLAVSSKCRVYCYAYLSKKYTRVTFNIYTKENASAEQELAYSTPGVEYNLTSASCTNGVSISFNATTRAWTIPDTKTTECTAVFTKAGA